MGRFARARRRAVAGLGMALLASAGSAASPGCSKDEAEAETCAGGTEGCPCTLGGACDPGLACYSNRCVEDPDTASGDADGEGGDAGEAAGGETDAGGASPAAGEPGAGGTETGGEAPTSGGAGTGATGGGEPGSGGEPIAGGAETGGGGEGTGGASTGGATSGGETIGGDGPSSGGAETGGDAPTTGGVGTGGEAPTSGGAETGGAGGAAGAGTGGAPPEPHWLTCANDECCFDTCNGQTCGVREFTSCTIALTDGDERSICGGTEVCRDDVVVLPAWFAERECVLNWLEGNYSPGTQAYVFGGCPCEIEGYVVTEPVSFVSAEGGNVCDFAEVPDPACAGVSLEACL